ncbi:MAG: ArsJ-associated glyceraldehyde-3-phosphate dehydrogenase [Oleiphilaceae bacterium]|nr:ArsJ-associated glyceraldehyde-3-phosphate dehydrogenase [Oleiphilaceae bacterium]
MSQSKVRIVINGFGRMGRLALRAAWGWPGIEIVHVNEIAGDNTAMAHLLQFDSVHGTWDKPVSANGKGLEIDGQHLSVSHERDLNDLPWSELHADIVVDCTGAHKSQEILAQYLKHGVKKVLVSAPVKDGPLNIVMGVNDDRYDATKHAIVTAASCTTNCIAPVVDVLHQEFGIKHGSMTTIHDITNTQSILDEYHKDLRRARACGMSLIPTTTGSATAITEIFPELKGRLNGVAVRVPLANASLTDCVFELEQDVTVDAVNAALQQAANGRLKNILGYEERPLVSVDYTNDPRSGVVDAPSTMVINQRQVKILVWYDNEWGYVHRMMELAQKLAASIADAG